MAEGIEVEVADGFARIQFLDKSKAGEALHRLLEVGGPGLIDTDTRSGRRKIYIVPESVAADAGLLDDEPQDEPAQPEPEQPEYPEGDPSDSWTVPQLRAYAAAQNIDLGDATKKADVLAAIQGPAEPTVIAPPDTH